MNIVYVQARQKYNKHTMPILIFFIMKKIENRSNIQQAYHKNNWFSWG